MKCGNSSGIGGLVHEKKMLSSRNLNEKSAKCEKENQCQNPKALGNLMTDLRVYRGNTYALRSTAIPWPTLDPVKARVTIDKAVKRKSEESSEELGVKDFNRSMRRYEKQCSKYDKSKAIGAKSNSRKEITCQTEPFLEEIYDKEMETVQECQTDPLPDRPPSPLFVPKKSGIDIETQIMDGDLFDFDMECQPMIENLIGKVMEQALLELMEEQELQQIEIQKNGHRERRQIELVELQRLESEEARKVTEIEMRVKE